MGDKCKKSAKPVQIYSTNDKESGMRVIKSDVKLVILDMLKETDMEFDEIVLNTGKSKSTISVHLKSLREKGIINYKMDPNDNRKKIFYLSSKYMGSVDVKECKDIEQTKAEYLIEEFLKDDVNFSFLLFHTLRSNLIQKGISIDPFLYDTGYSIGEAAFESLYDEDLEKFSQNIEKFWKDKGLGDLKINLGQIIKISNNNCFECTSLPKIGTPACFLDSGMLEALFSKYFEMPLNIIETKCSTMGDSYCEFEIEPLSLDKVKRLNEIN